MTLFKGTARSLGKLKVYISTTTIPMTMTLSARGLARSCDKLKAFYLHHHNANDHQTWKDGYFEGLLHIKSYDHLITYFCEIIWETKSILSPLPQSQRPSNLAGGWLTFRDSYPISYDPLLKWSSVHVTKWKHTSTTTIPMSTKLGRVVTYNEELPLIKLYDPCIRCFFQVT